MNCTVWKRSLWPLVYVLASLYVIASHGEETRYLLLTEGFAASAESRFLRGCKRGFVDRSIIDVAVYKITGGVQYPVVHDVLADTPVPADWGSQILHEQFEDHYGNVRVNRAVTLQMQLGETVYNARFWRFSALYMYGAVEQRPLHAEGSSVWMQNDTSIARIVQQHALQGIQLAFQSGSACDWVPFAEFASDTPQGPVVEYPVPDPLVKLFTRNTVIESQLLSAVSWCGTYDVLPQFMRSLDISSLRIHFSLDGGGALIQIAPNASIVARFGVSSNPTATPDADGGEEVQLHIVRSSVFVSDASFVVSRVAGGPTLFDLRAELVVTGERTPPVEWVVTVGEWFLTGADSRTRTPIWPRLLSDDDVCASRLAAWPASSIGLAFESDVDATYYTANPFGAVPFPNRSDDAGEDASTPTPDDASLSSPAALSTGAIVGIIVGSLCVVIVACMAVLLMFGGVAMRRKGRAAPAAGSQPRAHRHRKEDTRTYAADDQEMYEVGELG